MKARSPAKLWITTYEKSVNDTKENVVSEKRERRKQNGGIESRGKVWQKLPAWSSDLATSRLCRETQVCIIRDWDKLGLLQDVEIKPVKYKKNIRVSPPAARHRWKCWAQRLKLNRIYVILARCNVMVYKQNVCLLFYCDVKKCCDLIYNFKTVFSRTQPVLGILLILVNIAKFVRVDQF